MVQHAASGSSLAGTNENGKGRQECTLYGIGRQSYYVATCIAVLASALIIYTVCMHMETWLMLAIVTLYIKMY